MSGEPQAGAGSDPTAQSHPSEEAPNTLLNALVGGIVGIVLSFIPFSTVLGGAVAGYLQGGTYGDGAKVGALAGLVALVPFVLVFGVVLFFVPVLAVPGTGPEAGILLVVVFVLLLGAFYVVGLSVLGGVVGIYLNEEV